MASSLNGIIIDVSRRSAERWAKTSEPAAVLASVSQWWANNLGRRIVVPDEGGEHRYAVLESYGGVNIEVQIVDETTSGVHIDIDAKDVAAKVTELKAAGCTVVRTHPSGWITLASPFGHRFCVLPVDCEPLPKAPTFTACAEVIDSSPAIRMLPAPGCVFEGIEGPVFTVDMLGK